MLGGGPEKTNGSNTRFRCRWPRRRDRSPAGDRNQTRHFNGRSSDFLVCFCDMTEDAAAGRAVPAEQRDGEPPKMNFRIPVIPIPSVRADEPSPENWGGALSARGLDALQAIREAADATLQQQGSEHSLVFAGSRRVSPISPSQSPPRSPQPSGRTPLTAQSRRRARGGRPQHHENERSPMLHFRMPCQEAGATEGSEPVPVNLPVPVNFTSAILPPTPQKYDGLPPRRLRLPKAKAADPPAPMYSTSAQRGALDLGSEAKHLPQEYTQTDSTPRSREKQEKEAPVQQRHGSSGDPTARPDRNEPSATFQDKVLASCMN